MTDVIPSGYVVMRSFDIVRQDPKHLVTALRIIEREEQLDLYLLDQQKKTGFLPPGRPKFWRNKSLEKLRYSGLHHENLSDYQLFSRENVFQKVEGNQLENREENKMWLGRTDFNITGDISYFIKTEESLRLEAHCKIMINNCPLQ